MMPPLAVHRRGTETYPATLPNSLQERSRRLDLLVIGIRGRPRLRRALTGSG
jgi:nucleotide-binding universal stress UspA family protein